MPIQTLTTLVTADQAGRADIVVRALTQVSHSKLRGMFDNGCITINGQPCDDAGQRVKPGDSIDVRYDPQQGYREKKKAWTDRTFSILYEDQHVIVVNKAAHALTVATDTGSEINTLVERVSLYLRQTSHKREALPVHRLDRGVSGLLVLAKTPAALANLQEQFKQRKPQRRYMGIVAGHVQQAAGTFESYLETGKNLDQFSTFEEDKGQLAITHYQVRKLLPGATWVEVRLETGRRNQIRVHFADAGHPVLGDPRYKPTEAKHAKWQNNRLALHAVSLGFEHPATGKYLEFESRLPNAMLRFVGKG